MNKHKYMVLVIIIIVIIVLASTFPFIAVALGNTAQNLNPEIYYGFFGDICGGLIGAAFAILVFYWGFKDELDKSREEKLYTSRGIFELNYILKKELDENLLRYLCCNKCETENYLAMKLSGQHPIFDCKVQVSDDNPFLIGLVVPEQFIIIPITETPVLKRLNIAITYKTVMNEHVAHRLQFKHKITDEEAKETMYAYKEKADMEEALHKDINSEIKNAKKVFASDSRLFCYPNVNKPQCCELLSYLENIPRKC